MVGALEIGFVEHTTSLVKREVRFRAGILVPEPGIVEAIEVTPKHTALARLPDQVTQNKTYPIYNNDVNYDFKKRDFAMQRYGISRFKEISSRKNSTGNILDISM